MPEGQDLESGASSAPNAEVLETSTPANVPIIQKNRWTWLWIVAAVLLAAGILLSLFYLRNKTKSRQASSPSVKVQEVDASGLPPTASSFTVDNNRVIINGELQATQSVVVIPSNQPTNSLVGQIYLDQDDKVLYYYNGEQYVPMGASTATNITNVTELTEITEVTNVYSTSGSSLDAADFIQNQVALDQTADFRISGTGQANTSLLTALLDSPSGTMTLNIGTNNATGGISLDQDTTVASGNTLSVYGTALFQPSIDSSSAFRVRNTSDQNLFNVDTLAGNVSVRTVLNTFDKSSAGDDSLDLTLRSGNATGAGSDSGDVTIDAGTATGTAGSVNIGTTTAPGVNIGHSSSALALQGTATLDGTLDVNGVAAFGNNSSVGAIAGIGVGHTFSSGGSCAFGCYGVLSNATASGLTGSDALTGGYFASSTDASSFTLGTAHGLTIGSGSLGAGSTITNNYGIYVNNQTKGVNDYGIYLQGADSYGLYVAGAGTSGVAAHISNGSSTGNILQLQDNTTNVLTVADGGAATFQAASGANAFQVQNTTTGAQLLNIDSTNTVITINGSNVATLQTWSTTTALDAPGRYAHGGFMLGGNLYVVSGDTGTSSSGISFAKVNVDGTIGSWTATTSAPEPARYGAMIAGNGHVYMVGGQDGSSTPSDDINYGRVNSDGTITTWFTTETKLLDEMVGGSGVYANGYLYVAGGTPALAGSPSVPDAASAATTVQYAKVNADGSPGSFVATGSLPAARTGGSLVAANGYMYYVGGQNTGGTAQTQVYYAKIKADGTLVKNDDTEGWETDSDTTLPAGRSYHGSVVLNGYVYVLGGGSSATSANNTVYAAALNGDGSLGAFSATTSLGTAASSAAAVTANGYVYVVGGYGSGSIIDDVQYTSAPRLSVAGSLDLVGLSGENLHDGGSGGTLTAGNTRVLGTLDVSDEARFSDGIVVNGDLQAGGQVTFKNITDSEVAFQIQNAAGNALFMVDTANTIIQPGFARTSTIVSRDYENRISDASNDIGQGIDMAMGSDGKPLIIAVTAGGANPNALMIYKCFVSDCSTGASTPNMLTDITYSSTQTSIALGTSDRLPVIAYRNSTNTRLGVLHCGNQACNSGNLNTTTISHQSGQTQTGLYPSIAMGYDGYPMIANGTGNNNDLVFTKCTNATCSSYNSSAAVAEEPVAGNYGNFNSLAINPIDNIPTVSHYLATSAYRDLVVTRCLDVACSYNSGADDTETNVISSPDAVGKHSTIAFTADGIPIIAAYNETKQQIFYVRCGNESCSSDNFTINIGPAAAVASQHIGMALTTEGLPLITYKEDSTTPGGGKLGILYCKNIYCTSTQSLTLNITGTDQDGTKSQVLFNPDNGLPLIVTGSDLTGDGATNNYIAIARCADPTCMKANATAYAGGVNLGGLSLPFGNVLTDSINDGRPSARLRLTSSGDFYANTLSVDTSGNASFKAASSRALRVESSNTGGVALNIDTYGSNNNLIRNYGNFEINSYGWEAKGSATLDQDPNYAATGDYSLSVDTTTAAGDGTKYKVRLTANRKYSVKFKALVSSGTVTGMSFGYAADGSTDTDCRSGQTLSSTEWTSYSCVFTPGAVSGAPYFYIKRSDTSASTINLDDVILVAGGDASIVPDGDFESAGDVTTWVALGSASRSHNTNATYVNTGTGSMQIVTGTTDNSGAKFPIVLNPSTNYAIQFAVKATASMTTLYYGYSPDGTTTNETDCSAAAASVSSSAFTTYSCVFTTPSEISGTPYFYTKRTGTTNYTYYIDDLEVIRASIRDLVANGDVESSTTNWAVKGSSTIAQTYDESYLNDASLKVTTTAVANDGVKHNITLAPSTTYTVQFYAKLESGTLSTLDFGFAQDGSTETDCSTGNSLTTTGWRFLTCSFTTGTSVPSTSSKAYFYIDKTGASTPVIYVDALRIDYGSNAGGNQDYKTQINGVINSPTTFQAASDSDAVFKILGANGSPILIADSMNGRIGIGTTSPSTALDVTGGAHLTTTLDVDGYSAFGNSATLNSIEVLQVTHSFGSSSNCILGCYGAFSDVAANDPTNPNLLSAYYAKVSNSHASAALTSAAGLYVASAASSGGTIAANYGINIQNQTAGASDYGLYIQGADTYALWVDSGTSRFDGNVVPGSASSVDLGSSSLEFDEVYIGDNNGVVLGLDQDATLAYDETTDDRVELTGSGASLFIEDRLALGALTATLTDEGTANDSITPASSYYRIDADETADAGVPDLTISESGAKDGQLLTIINYEGDGSHDTFTITNSSGVVHLPGAATLTLGPYDGVTLIYANDRWITLSSSDN